MHDDADFTVMKVHMCKYDKTYMWKILNPKIDKYDVVWIY
jgi:hypothetical protein